MPTIAGGAVDGASQQSITAVTAAYTILTTDEVVTADATGGNFTVKLPLPSTMTGQIVRVIKITAANAVTVDGVLTSYIRAAGKSTLSNNGSQVSYVSDGSFWDNVGAIS